MELSQRRGQLVGRLRHRKTRIREGLILVEGIRSVGEALDAGAAVSFAVISPRLHALGGGAELSARLDGLGADMVRVSDEILGGLGDTEHPQGVLLVCREPEPQPDLLRGGGRYLILDGVQDPGNVGTLLRGAAAFDMDGVVALDGTADPWAPKTVRAAAGMSFRTPILSLTAGGALAALAEAEIPLLVADTAGGDVADYEGKGGWALAVGNEGAGPRDVMRGGAAAVVRIPMPGPAESLNVGVAGSILLYALTREGVGAP